MKEYNDYELLYYISEKNEDASDILLKKYDPLIISIAKNLYKSIEGTGIEISDLIQEGRLGLFNASDTFSESKDTLFYTYAKTCIERKMYDLIKSINRNKNKILNNSIPIEIDDEKGEYKSLDYLLKDDKENPEKLLIEEENKTEKFDIINSKLNEFEIRVLELKLDGYDNKEIASITNTDYKKIDNTLQRIKQKLKQTKKSN